MKKLFIVVITAIIFMTGLSYTTYAKDNNEDNINLIIENQVKVLKTFIENHQMSSSSADIDTVKKYLDSEFSTVDIGIDTWKLSYNIDENTLNYYGYDWLIQTNWKSNKVSPHDLEHSIKYTDEEKEFAIEQLKNVQLEIYDYLSTVCPTKKVEGEYYFGWYKYPNIKEGWTSIKFLSWKNYDGDSFNDYDSTKVSEFSWDNFTDTYFK